MKPLLILVTAILIAGCGNTTQPAATVTVTPPAATPTVQTMTDWKHSAADEVGAMGDALIAVGDAMKAYDLPAMRVSCTQLRTSVDQLDRELPSPDPQVNAAFDDTIDDYRSLSQLCMTITPSSTAGEINEMHRLLDRGGNRMTDAFNLMGLNTSGR